MTMLSIDGALVIFEGIHRLRWVSLDLFSQSDSAGGAGSAQRTLSHTWPDRYAGARIRRQIDQSQRVVVVIESKTTVITLARHQVPKTPLGAVELAGVDSTACRLTIPPFTWLSENHRRRGEEFLEDCTEVVDGSARGTTASVLVEDSLIGRAEPVRFVYGTAPLTFGVLRTTIDRLYKGGAVADQPVSQLAELHPDPPMVTIGIQKAA